MTDRYDSRWLGRRSVLSIGVTSSTVPQSLTWASWRMPGPFVGCSSCGLAWQTPQSLVRIHCHLRSVKSPVKSHGPISATSCSEVSSAPGADRSTARARRDAHLRRDSTNLHKRRLVLPMGFSIGRRREQGSTARRSRRGTVASHWYDAMRAIQVRQRVRHKPAAVGT